MKCDICEQKIRWYHGIFTTYDKRNLHTECFADEVFAERIARTLDNMAKIKTNAK